jgi:hypothetical protein
LGVSGSCYINDRLLSFLYHSRIVAVVGAALILILIFPAVSWSNYLWEGRQLIDTVYALPKGIHLNVLQGDFYVKANESVQIVEQRYGVNVLPRDQLNSVREFYQLGGLSPVLGGLSPVEGKQTLGVGGELRPFPTWGNAPISRSKYAAITDGEQVIYVTAKLYFLF